MGGTQIKSFSACTHIRARAGLVDFNEPLGKDQERMRGAGSPVPDEPNSLLSTGDQ